jgi:phage host-nuclease inhibitor protein Gam
MTLEQACEQSILEYAPYHRQINALNGEHTEYVNAVLAMHRAWYQRLTEDGFTEWTELPAEHIQWMNENRPY